MEKLCELGPRMVVGTVGEKGSYVLYEGGLANAHKEIQRMFDEY